jgi:hypothetical protein
MTTTDQQALHSLHQAIARCLLDLIPTKPSADLLHVGRSFLKDNGLLGLAQTPADRKRLERLYGVYVRQLTAALEAPHPPTAVLSEVRQFLTSQGVGKDLATATDRGNTLKTLEMGSLPFNTH